MAVIKELIRKGANGTLSFGNFELDAKQKKSDFKFEGDLYKVKTFKEITRLEKNEMFVYESVPGTVVTDFKVTDQETSFVVEGLTDTSITLELEPEAEYEVFVDDTSFGKMKADLGGKINLSLEIDADSTSKIRVAKL